MQYHFPSEMDYVETTPRKPDGNTEADVKGYKKFLAVYEDIVCYETLMADFNYFSCDSDNKDCSSIVRWYNGKLGILAI